MSEKLIDLEEAERSAKRAVVKRAESEVRNIIIESTDLEELAGIPIFKVDGFMDVVTQPRRFLTPEKVERKYFTVKLDAKTGKIYSIK